MEVAVASGEKTIVERNRNFGELSIELPAGWPKNHASVNIDGSSRGFQLQHELEPGEHVLRVVADTFNHSDRRLDYYQSVRVESGANIAISTASMGVLTVNASDETQARQMRLFRISGEDQSLLMNAFQGHDQIQTIYLSPGKYMIDHFEWDRSAGKEGKRTVWARDIEISAGRTVEIAVGE